MIDDPRLPDRFWAKVSPEPNTGCWLWHAGASGRGYGQFKLRGRLRPAHRVSFEALAGSIPAGLHLDHLCRTRLCVSPLHLEPVTCAENIRRGETGQNNARKTHCPHGHAYSPENTWLEKDGRRHCRTCHRERRRRVAA